MTTSALTEILAPFSDAWVACHVDTDARTVRRWRQGTHFPRRRKWRDLAFHVNRPVADIEAAYTAYRADGRAGQ